jgi:hypothetical protein
MCVCVCVTDKMWFEVWTHTHIYEQVHTLCSVPQAYLPQPCSPRPTVAWCVRAAPALKPTPAGPLPVWTATMTWLVPTSPVRLLHHHYELLHWLCCCDVSLGQLILELHLIELIWRNGTNDPEGVTLTHPSGIPDRLHSSIWLKTSMIWSLSVVSWLLRKCVMMMLWGVFVGSPKCLSMY